MNPRFGLFDQSANARAEPLQFEMEESATSSEEVTNERPIKVMIASNSAIKIAAVTKALNNHSKYQIIAIDVSSNVNAQPFNHETTAGVINRIDNAMRIDNTGDVYIAIENGVYEKDDKILDKAVIWLKCRRLDDTFADYMTISDSVEFPRACFDIAKKRGFATTTVADVMQEQGLVTDSKDPHKSLGNKTSRLELLVKALEKMDIESKRQKALLTASSYKI